MENDDDKIYYLDNEITIKTSIADYLEPVNGGVCVLILLSIYHFNFQGIYWIHPEGHYFLECEANFLKLWGETNTLKLPFYVELCKDIECILPDKKHMFKEILGV
jgi:hypothetical protein